MFFTIDEFNEKLFLNGCEVPTEDGEIFDLLASRVAGIKLSDIPPGCKIHLCDRVFGATDELHARYPAVEFENSADHGLLAHLSTPFVPPSEDYPVNELFHYFETAVQSGRQTLQSLERSGRVLKTEPHVYDDIAYLNCSIRMPDLPIQDAEEFIRELDDRILSSKSAPTLFLCHASEDKSFVDRLAEALDMYALHAWYDRREILVGDSIVERINNGLKASDFLVAVLSPRSVTKPWVVREMGSSLMRQLTDAKITVLPLMMESCELPPLLADIKYANFTGSFDQGFQELLSAVRRTSPV